jgi:hypothetical protein
VLQFATITTPVIVSLLLIFERTAHFFWSVHFSLTHSSLYVHTSPLTLACWIVKYISSTPTQAVHLKHVYISWHLTLHVLSQNFVRHWSPLAQVSPLDLSCRA